MGTRSSTAAFVIGVLIFGCAATAGGEAARVTLHPDWQLPADTRSEGGDIVNPTICPADTDWLSWEVHDESSVALYIYNRSTAEKRQVHIASDDELLTGSSTGWVDRGLCWRPTLHDDDVWLAYVGDANGAGCLCLYNVTDDEYYIPPIATDESGTLLSVRSPSWSPDGSCLAFTSNVSGDDDILVLRNMKRWLSNPGDSKMIKELKVLAGGPGNQFGCVWNPAIGSCLAAYTHHDRKSGRYEVRICDIRIVGGLDDPTLSYRVNGISESYGFFGPTWSPGGNYLGFYRYEFAQSGQRVQDTLGDSYDLMIGELALDCRRGTFDIRSSSPNGRFDQPIARVACNRDRSRGIAWLSHDLILVSVFDAQDRNQLWAIDIPRWSSGSQRDSWSQPIFEFFHFPGDVMVRDSAIVFTFQNEMKRDLLVGSLRIDCPACENNTLDVCEDRLAWWNDYCDASTSVKQTTRRARVLD